MIQTIRSGERSASSSPHDSDMKVLLRNHLARIATLILVLSPLCAAEEDVAPAVKAAESWLALVDGKEYKTSWTETAVIFQKRIKENDWIKAATLVRDPFGGVITRKLKSAEYRTSVPGAPDGHYVVIQFETSFEEKKAAIETITPVKNEKGEWKVSGYFIE